MDNAETIADWRTGLLNALNTQTLSKVALAAGIEKRSLYRLVSGLRAGTEVNPSADLVFRLTKYLKETAFVGVK